MITYLLFNKAEIYFNESQLSVEDINLLIKGINSCKTSGAPKIISTCDIEEINNAVKDQNDCVEKLNKANNNAILALYDLKKKEVSIECQDSSFGGPDNPGNIPAMMQKLLINF